MDVSMNPTESIRSIQLALHPRYLTWPITNTADKQFYITNEDLKKRKFPIEDLMYNSEMFDLSTLLTYQTLDADFCKNYVLNEEYQTAEESYWIDIPYILRKQPHLKYEDLID